MSPATAIFQILVFPGFLFLAFLGLAFEYLDRIFYARFQNRVGPPWFQPLADFIKLISKETVLPLDADNTFFKAMPVVALASVVCAALSIPMWSFASANSFSGDVIVVLYLLTLPTFTFFLGGWYSRSVYSMIGAARTLIQLFAYEVPLFLSILAPALLADSLSLEGISRFYSANPLLILVNIPALVIAVIAMLGKLEKVPFDIPEAETEIVAGSFTEYSGRYLGLFRLAIDIEMVVGAALLASVFLPFGLSLPIWAGIPLFLIKLAVIIELISLARSVCARLRLDQMIDFCWRYFAPLALLQVVINLVVKGLVLS